MTTYQINEIYPAIQGEGYNTGRPGTIIRMQGCNLRCPWCDSSKTLKKDPTTQRTLEDILYEVLTKGPPKGIALITGGEPTMQNLGPLVDALSRKGIPTHLETNGTLPIKAFPKFTWMTISPKQVAGYNCHSSAVELGNEVKWLIQSEEDITSLMYWLGTWRWDSKKIVSLQPISMDPSATQICYDACLKYGWHLSIQTHKLLGVK